MSAHGNGAATPKLTPKKSACLTIFFFDDSLFKTLFQNGQVNLQHCIDGYDRSVLLKEEFGSVGQSKPTKLLKPNKAVFLNQLNELTDEGFWFDIRIMTHGSTDRIMLANDKDLRTSDLEAALKESGYGAFPIRTVYMMNCYGHTFNQTWLGIGAKASCGTRLVNFWSNEFNAFAKEWEKGTVGFAEAIRLSNTESARSVMEGLIMADALGRSNFDKCPIFSTVLGDKPCAKSYFCANWGLNGGEWQEGKSGKENMAYSSYMFRVGMTTLTANDTVDLQWHP